MAEKFGLGNNEVRELKIGQSFTDPKSIAFHTVRYDFKPASVDTSKKATVDVGSNHQVTVTVPHLDGAGTTQTVFKGSQRPYTKECVLIIDRVTGEITLEKLGCNIQVKKTRSEYNNRMPHPPERPPPSQNSLSSRSATPPTVGSRVSSKTKVTSGSRRPERPITHLVPKHSPLHASPNHRSPPGTNNNVNRREQHNNSVVNESHNNHNTLASLPMIGIDDFNDTLPVPTPHTNSFSQPSSVVEKSPTFPTPDNENGVGEISDSSSSSSDSDSDSDIENAKIPKTNGYTNGNNVHLLNEDLCLSESGSDSD